MKLAFLSDIHLNFIAKGAAQHFLEKVSRRADVVIKAGQRPRDSLEKGRCLG